MSVRGNIGRLAVLLNVFLLIAVLVGYQVVDQQHGKMIRLGY